MIDLFNKLEEYNDLDYYPFHMPGHKRNLDWHIREGFCQLDITEIEGFDNLHDPRGIIKEAMDYASEVFKSSRTYFLINGSTSGILSAISAVTKSGDRIAVSRNSHHAIYHAIDLKNLDVKYLYPEYIAEYELNGSISPSKVTELLENDSQIKAVVITSPTMQGVVSDISSIADICHENKVVLIVDEAHGAHFGFTPEFPLNSNQNNADIVIQSLHKTLPSPTQTAVLHVNGENIDIDRLEYYLGVYQTSSPSYLLMGGIFRCIRLVKDEIKERLNILMKYHEMINCASKEFKNIKIFSKENIDKSNCFDFDYGKIIILINNHSCTGKQLYDILLNKYSLQLEMYDKSYALAILTGYDTIEGVNRLISALRQIDSELGKENRSTGIEMNQALLLSCKTESDTTISRAMESPKIHRKIKECEGYISAGFIFIYPPGVPILVPGEVISQDIINWIEESKKIKLNVQGLENNDTCISIIEK